MQCSDAAVRSARRSRRYRVDLAGLDPANADVTGSIRERLLGEAAMPGGLMIDRARKGDYGFAPIGGRSLALKGDLLKPPASTDTALERAAPVAPEQTLRNRDENQNAQSRCRSSRRPRSRRSGRSVAVPSESPKRGGPSPAGAGTYRLASINPMPPR